MTGSVTLSFAWSGNDRSRAIHTTSPAWGLLFILAAVTLALAMSGCAGSDGSDGKRGPTGPPGPGPGPDLEGFQLTIDSVTIPASLAPVIEFTMEDDNGEPIELADLDRDPRWAIGWIDVDPVTGISRYQNYRVTSRAGDDYVDPVTGATVPPALAMADQAGTDSGGTHEQLAPGTYRYTFGTVLPATYDPDATHTIAGYAHRGDRSFVLNPVIDFVPSGAAVTETRRVVNVDNCNNCHNPLGLHGGVRRDTRLCVLCHTDQTTDPETGNSVELKHMVHRIHKGADRSVKPYFIVGFDQDVHDYTELHYPQDVRNCTKCHSNAADADNWRTRPSRSACGGCHDNVDFVSGAGHPGGPQLDDQGCQGCHADTMSSEFDQSVPGAHVVPYGSSFNPQLTLDIYDVQNMTPGNSPDVSFTIADASGPVDINTLDRVAIVFGGPTTDYTQLISVDHRFTIVGFGAGGNLTTNALGDYTWTDGGYNIPGLATGTWSVGMEARTAPIPVDNDTIEFGANNPVVNVDLLDGTFPAGPTAMIVTRRQVVDEAATCSSCHGDLVMHGNLRTDIEYCVMCHNPWTTDEARRPGVDPVLEPPESIDFKYLIHRLHTGAEQSNPYIVWGFGPTEHDFSEIHFPGDRRDCESCHLPDTWKIPVSKDLEAVVVNIAGVTVPQLFAIKPPTTAACTGCHDATSTMAHAEVMSVIVDEWNWAESCATCHGPGKDFDIEVMHARD